MKKKCMFIVTNDKKTADKLISGGLRLVSEINGTYTFENKPSNIMIFDNIDKTKMAYTNTLCL